jgi:hypothetical protein
MGCEFSDKVRTAKKKIVKEMYDKLTGPHQCKFVSLYGFPEHVAEISTYEAYYHCKRVIKTY